MKLSCWVISFFFWGYLDPPEPFHGQMNFHPQNINVSPPSPPAAVPNATPDMLLLEDWENPFTQRTDPVDPSQGTGLVALHATAAPQLLGHRGC